ncbi:MAG: hypothetical protein H8E86_04140 [Planctomycetes bacterium]|nr:hypothetical protein [Planctomycetota bacterium]
MSTLQLLILCLQIQQNGAAPIEFPASLDERTLARLQTVVDGPDTRSEGFAALIEEVQGWSSEFVAQHDYDRESILVDPASARGRLYWAQGTAEFRNILTSPWNGIEEWFVRDSSGDLFCLYIAGEPRLELGMYLNVPARFYKTIEIEGRDQRLRMYPTFVTSSIVMPTLASTGVSPMVLLLPVIALGAILVFLLSRIGKGSKRQRGIRGIETEDVIDAVNEHVGDLPEDSSKALAAMYEQSEAKL